jgi:hypothetical protein
VTFGEAVGAARLVSTPSSNWRLGSGLVWRQYAETFPDFERIHGGVSDLGAQFLGNWLGLYAGALPATLT